MCVERPLRKFNKARGNKNAGEGWLKKSEARILNLFSGCSPKESGLARGIRVRFGENISYSAMK